MPEKVDVAVDTRDGIDAGEPEDDLSQRLCISPYYYDPEFRTIHNSFDCGRIRGKQKLTGVCEAKMHGSLWAVR